MHQYLHIFEYNADILYNMFYKQLKYSVLFFPLLLLFRLWIFPYFL